MKIRSKSLSTLLFAATSAATSVLLFSSSPAQAVNLIKNGNFGGTVDFPWEGTAEPPTSQISQPARGNIYQLLSEPTDPLRQYRISFDFRPGDLGGQFNPNGFLQVSIGDTRLASLNYTSPSIFTQIFNGNGSNKLAFEYRLLAGSSRQFVLNNLAVEDLSPPSATPAPEPLTIVGTIIGTTAAFRLKKRLEASKKEAAS